MQEIIIRRATSRDCGALARIGRATFTDTFGHLYAPEDLETFLTHAYGEAYLADLLDDPACGLWLAEKDGAPVGHGLAGPCTLPHPEVDARSGEIKRLYLLGEAQGHGVGARLFETMTAWLEARDLTDLWLGVWSENHGAQRFYGRYGFEKVGEYGFHVGAAVDREFIFRKRAQIF
ncbi:GNAT family N-acetyltransferase [Phenylobacterium sp.]|uniref:GNAT family N-acetyltransferase n=1 Tax=Phenylobacterium sp. TaxID=1871053 RepID=UPI002FD9BCDB